MIIYCQTYEMSGKMQHNLQHILGRKLLKLALKKEYNIDFSEDMIEFMKNGKPVLKRQPVYFNISHCKGMVVCALADCPIGVDVEGTRKIGENVINKACNEQEKEYILKHDITRAFLEIWTLKESYLKMTGEGMRIPFSQVNFNLQQAAGREDGGWCTPDKIQCNRKGYFFQRQVADSYILSVCTKELCIEPEVIFL